MLLDHSSAVRNWDNDPADPSPAQENEVARVHFPEIPFTVEPGDVVSTGLLNFTPTGRPSNQLGCATTGNSAGTTTRQ